MERNVFLAALPHSGSTLLGVLLQQHEMIYHAGESFYWDKIDPRTATCSCGATGCEILIALRRRIKNSPHSDSILSIGRICGLIDRLEEPFKQAHPMSLSYDIAASSEAEVADALPSCINGLCRLADTYRDVSGLPVVADNSKYIRLTSPLIAAGWKIVVVVRDPRGLAYANKKVCARKHVNRPIEQKLGVYTSFARRAATISRQCDSVHVVRYEDMCCNPQAELGKIYRFLGLAYSNIQVAIKNTGHALAGNRFLFRLDHADIRIREDRTWQESLSADDLEKIISHKELLDAYRYFGYAFNSQET